MNPTRLSLLRKLQGRADACGLLLLGAVAACSPNPPSPSIVTAPAIDSAAAAPIPTMAAHSPHGAGGTAAGAPAASSVTGSVAETMDAASYTYVRLTTAQGDVWAAVPQSKVAVGDTVTIANPTEMDAFESPTLKRKFDRILFGTLATGAAAAGAGNPHAALVPGASSPVPSGPPVPRATGANARTIAEVLAGKATLKDKTVTVRGRVTKYNAAILGKNWLHVTDGNAKGPGDLVVTTSGVASVGDVVGVEGVVRADKDFGAGYSYPVMVEDATLTK